MSTDTIISVDAMGGDGGPGPILAGLSRALRADPSLRFILHGDEKVLSRQIGRRRLLKGRSDIQHAPDVVPMDEKPSRALRTGRNSSLWSLATQIAPVTYSFETCIVA